jgi:hypothetical protein
MFEILDLLFVFFRGFPCRKGPKVAAFFCLWVGFPRVDAVFTRFELAYHRNSFWNEPAIKKPGPHFIESLVELSFLYRFYPIRLKAFVKDLSFDYSFSR